MWRLLLLIIFIAGSAIGFSRISHKNPENGITYRITSLNVSHLKHTNIVDYNENYYLKLSFRHNLDSLTEKRKKSQLCTYYSTNPIIELKIISTEKMDEIHQPNTDITSLFNFHYVRNLKTVQGLLIKEGMTIPLNDFIYTVNQNESVNPLREFKLQLKQKPVLQSQHRFIVTAKLENGEILRDTTPIITFEGVNHNISYR